MPGLRSSRVASGLTRPIGGSLADWPTDEEDNPDDLMDNYYAGGRGRAPAGSRPVESESSDESSDESESSEANRGTAAQIDVDELSRTMLNGLIAHAIARKTPIDEKTRADGFLSEFRTIVASALSQQGIGNVSVERDLPNLGEILHNIPPPSQRKDMPKRDRMSVMCDIVGAPKSVAQRVPANLNDDRIFDPSLT